MGQRLVLCQPWTNANMLQIQNHGTTFSWCSSWWPLRLWCRIARNRFLSTFSCAETQTANEQLAHGYGFTDGLEKSYIIVSGRSKKYIFIQKTFFSGGWIVVFIEVDFAKLFSMVIILFSNHISGVWLMSVHITMHYFYISKNFHITVNFLFS